MSDNWFIFSLDSVCNKHVSMELLWSGTCSLACHSCLGLLSFPPLDFRDFPGFFNEIRTGDFVGDSTKQMKFTNQSDIQL